ncbi:cytochrome P450 [Nonomuraea guangzhouensis]|uniref:Cytochrome P450 n=1 Tax=Nonomuraea guangzhouensis TaxID=1291555 RepID=A0ABW4GTU4_9ACTN|nr:cytochrome P450 [Nonomuraea guangzhouensis]
MPELPRDLGELDLADPRTFREHDQYEIWRRLRREAPVFWNAPRGGNSGFWALTKYDDVVAVYKDAENYSSERGNVLTTLLAGGDSAVGRMLAVTDGKRHQDLRNVLLKAFSPRALAYVAERVRANTRDRVRAGLDLGTCDFAADVAEKIPINTISDLLGVPDGDRDLLLRLTKTALSSDTESDDPEEAAEESLMARNEILLYFDDLVAERRAKPREDVISTLVQAVVDGRPVSPDDVVFNCYSLIIGGDETSRLTMIGMVPALSANPDQWAALKSGEVSVQSAVEEILRWVSPAMHFGRTAVRDVTVRGQEIAAGDIVTLWNSAANRDEDVFTDAERLDLARTPNRHASFGYGPHFCLGAYLGRTEIGAMLEALRDLVDEMHITAEPERLHSNLLSGITSLQVKLTPRSSN